MRKVFLLTATLLSLLLAACQGPRQGYQLAVPKDAVAVAQLRLKRLAEKVNLSDTPLMSLLGRHTTVRQIFEDPALLGIDFDAPAYIFLTPERFVGMALKVEDETLLDAFVEQLTRERICEAIPQRGEGEFFTIADAALLCHDDELLLITLSLSPGMPPSSLLRYAAGRMERSATAAYFAGDSPLADADQALAILVHGAAMAQFRQLPATQIVEALLRPSLSQAGATLNDLGCLITAEEPTGRGFQAQLQLITPNDTLQRVLHERIARLPVLSDALLPYVGVADDATCLFACNGADLLQAIASDRDWRMALRSLEGVADVEAILRAIHGDVLLDWSHSGAEPNLTLLAQLANTDFTADIPAWQARATNYGLTFENTAQGQYHIAALGVDVYTGVKDSLFFLSTRPSPQPDPRQAPLPDAEGKRLYLSAQTPQGQVTLSSQDLLNYTATFEPLRQP